ncbi:MAG TPA: acyloxyacyl hydrolase [Stellaceae bacterium]|nr:acyloxyacyl hydrolase [Stellaceae bacterium]
MARAAVIGMLAALGVLAAQHPARAQLSIGSPGDPPRVALELGAFDIFPGKHPDSHVAADFGLEYRFGDVLYAFSPFIGALGTSDGAGYAYFGFGFDIHLGPNWILTPNGAAGVFERGSGIKLGSWWEFRTGAELDYKLPDQSRVGIALHHMSNAGLGKSNPGEESLVFVYTIPFGR